MKQVIVRLALAVAMGVASWRATTAGEPRNAPGETHDGGTTDAPTSTSLLRVEVVNVRAENGTLRVSVFAGPEGFLRDERHALARGAVHAADHGTALEGAVLEFRLPPGRYAVAILHDENDNGRLDTNFLGIPTEGYGVSNNPKPRFRAPRFHEAVFELPPGGGQARISLQYIG